MRDFDIDSDLKQEKFQSLKLVQGDRGNKIKINVYEDGQPVKLTGCSVTAKYKRADGEIINDGVIENIHDNSFDAVMDSSITKVAGTLKMLFTIEKDDVKVSTFLLLADVRESIGENTGSSGGNTGGGSGEVTIDLSNYYKKIETYSKNQIDARFKDIAKQVENVGQPTQQQINTAIDKAIEEGRITGSGGINSTAKTLLETILRNAIYTTDQSANITSLVSALSSGNTPTTTHYTITNTLTKCTNNNINTSVAENTSYIATITPNNGYKLDTVTVTMGGKDVTSTVYNNGKITINSVTGNIVIIATAIEKSSIAELPQDGLDIFFDYRNSIVTSPYNLSGWGNVAKVEPNGNNDYFVFSSTGTYTTDNHGIANFGTRGLRKKSAETTNYIGNGNSHTIIGMTYGTCIPSLYDATKATNLPNSIQFAPYYKNTNGESNKLLAQGITAPNPKVNAEYVIFALSMSDTELKLYSDGQLIATANSSDCTDFASWNIIEGGFGCSFSGTNNYMTACAYYNRPLSDVEIVEATEYLKTLEVHN